MYHSNNTFQHLKEQKGVRRSSLEIIHRWGLIGGAIIAAPPNTNRLSN